VPLFFIAWILLCWLVGIFASNSRNRSAFNWAIFSLFFSPLLGFLFLLVMPPAAKADPLAAMTRPANDHPSTDCYY
jgi:hypothetical protein